MGRNWLQFIAVEWTQRKDSELLKVSSRFEILVGHSNQVIQMILTLENRNFAIFGLLIILARDKPYNFCSVFKTVSWFGCPI